ncbi:hypothetical protein PHMEG_00014512 [Phytophthora megakarya]|uniref:Tyr recombinase domain-containing protein n=1 Tax=Phytophthora megakarya TaxID=4795 RepID=A0A225W5P7_9STRA|nr:hypothetical protein PHMEG_00014512 [Phytophthora megakarya]
MTGDQFIPFCHLGTLVPKMLGCWEDQSHLRLSPSHVAGESPALVNEDLKTLWQLISERTALPISHSSLWLRLLLFYSQRYYTRYSACHQALFSATGADFPISDLQITMLLKGLKRTDPPSRRKAPLSVQLLESTRALGGVVHGILLPLTEVRIRAVRGVSYKWFPLRPEDVTVLSVSGRITLSPSYVMSVCIRLRGYKTNQSGIPTTRMLHRSDHAYLCPVFGALMLNQTRDYLSTSHLPFFRRIKPGCVSTLDIAEAIKAAAVQLDENPTRFSSHSFRAGGATHLYRAGIASLTIQFPKRWVYDAFKSYTRLCSESVVELSAKMVLGSREYSTLN